jgi:HAD superfamily hydrolase (TIGR01484 family)
MPEFNHFVIDFDGTLERTDAERIESPRTLATFGNLRGGTRVTLATARTPREILPVIQQLHLEGPHIAANGALVIDGDGSSIPKWERLITPDQSQEIIKAYSQYGNYQARLVGTGGEAWAHAREQKVMAAAVFHLLWVEEEHARMTLEELQVNSTLDGLHAYLTSGKNDKGQYHVSVTHAEATKYAALVRMYGGDLSNVVAVGNDQNDLCLCGEVGRMYAVADAHPELLAAVGEENIVASCADGGAAEVAERHFID